MNIFVRIFLVIGILVASGALFFMTGPHEPELVAFVTQIIFPFVGIVLIAAIYIRVKKELGKSKDEAE